MNDKIKEFASLSYNPDNGTMSAFDYEKFAELLLKEVFKVCDDVCDPVHNPEWLLCEMFGIEHNWRVKTDE